MTEPQPPRAPGPPTGTGGPDAGSDPAALSALTADAMRAHADYGAGALIVCDRLVRIYTAEGIEVQALQGLDLVVEAGELTALVGASGSGKSTLVNILAGLDTPTAGAVRVAGHDLATMSSRQRLGYRRSVVGFVWQQTARNLLPYLTAAQNAELPLRLAGAGRSARRKRAAELLDLLGVAHCAGGGPTRCPAASSSGSRSGWRWPTRRRCCSPTSRPASWTARRRRRCSARCRRPTTSSA